MSAWSRLKGAEGEREVVALLRDIFPSVRRRCSGEESQERQGRDLDGVPGLCIQVQRAKAPTIERKLREAEAAAEGSEYPVAFTRRCARGVRDPWLVTMLAEDFIEILCMARPERRC